MTNNIFYQTKDMIMQFWQSEDKMSLASISPAGNVDDMSVDTDFLSKYANPPFQLAIASKPYGYCYSLVSGATALPREMKMIKFCKTNEGLEIVYFHEQTKLEATVCFEFVENANFIRQHTKVRNLSDEEITLTHLSSSSIQGIASSGDLPWYDKRKIKVHYCRQSGQGEGQWRSGGLEELGMYPSSVHNQAGSVQFWSVGSRSTGRFMPMAIIEDMETGECWYFQIESSTHWHFEIGNYGINNSDKGVLFFHTNTADERYLGWKKVLKPGEEYKSCITGFGCCKGGFEDAVKEFTHYRRDALMIYPESRSVMPLIYNDYMNALWGEPTAAKLLPIIEKASEAGAEVFCIDAGWFSKENGDINLYLGDWVPDKERFAEYGLQGIIDIIKSKGMIPGIWFELEVCGAQSKAAQMPDDWFIRRNGVRVQDGPRLFYNFTNPQVREHFIKVLKTYVDMGIGYIKNDYNGCLGTGDDTLSDSAAQGQIMNVNAFYEFIDSVRYNFPDLILENCASGAMRQDYGILSHFHLQSNSDQEIYHYYPSIIQGESAILLPEHNGVWAYPYPLLFNDREKPGILSSDNYFDIMKNGEETIFNMVNGMCGVMLLSGHIECADDYNTTLIHEATSLYKTNRDFIKTAYPVYPTGIITLCERDAWASFGYINETKTKMLLTVWRLGSLLDNFEISLYKYFGQRNISVKMLYPSQDKTCKFNYSDYKLCLDFPNAKMARLFEITTNN